VTALLDQPLLLLALSFPVFGLATWLGALAHRRHTALEHDEDFRFVLGGTLTLLGLLLGFTFSMAVGRYDLRKNLEEQEANAIGTEYVRADLLPAEEAARVRALLRSYLAQRMRYYQRLDPAALRQLDAETARLQADMWSVVAAHGARQRDSVAALVVSGMNDVLNSQGYTQAAWRNRIPLMAWVLLYAIALFCNFLIGHGARRSRVVVFLVLPIALSITLFLIADIESPRGGVILVYPQNLEAVAASLREP
jgi:hypothetical protein